MSEQNLWEMLRRNLGRLPGFHLQRIENSCQADAPDVEYCIRGRSGWIELKYVPELPKRSGTVLRVDHYTDGQRLWHRRRAACGGRVFVLLRAERELLLFDGPRAAVDLGRTWTAADCREAAVLATRTPGTDWEGLIRQLTLDTRPRV